MVMSPGEIENHEFRRVWRGYDPAEVDDFLKGVAAAQAPAPAPRATTPAAPTGSGHDDFARLGEEVAAVLRQTHESVATLRRRAEADAAVIRQEAERDRQAAAKALEAAHAESARVMTDAQRRLEGTRHDIDQALDRLVVEDQEPFDTIDLTDTAPGDGPGPELVPPLEQDAPLPPVSPQFRTTPTNIEDLPYDDGPVGEPSDLSPVGDLTDGDGDDWLTAFEESHPA